MYIVRPGIPRDTNNNDLVFIGKCVNFATAIANQAHEPYHIEISKMTYDNLEDDWVYGVSNGKKVDMWKDSAVEWKGEKHRTKITNWYNKL